MKKDRERNLRIVLTYAALLVVSAAALFPFFWMTSTSLKTADQTHEFPPRLLPHPVMLVNYHDAVMSENANFPLWTRNTLIIAILAVLGTTASSSIVAYGFARIRFRGRGGLFALMLSTMMVPFPVMMVPLFTIFRWLGDHTGMAWLGTFKPLWAPAWLGSAFSIFMLRQFFMTVPEELSEAARIDGASAWRQFRHITLPMLGPTMLMVSILTVSGYFQLFAEPYVMTEGGPLQSTTSVLYLM